jgi:lathosterol oxidase
MMKLVAGLSIAVAAMTLIVWIRYLIVGGGFAWLTAKRNPGCFSGRAAQVRMEIGWSSVSAVIYAIPAGVVAWGWQAQGWTRIYTRLGDYPLWWLPLSVLLYLLAHDCWFYWTHRLLHRPAPFRLAHAIHHASRPPTAWAAMSFHPVEAVCGAVVIPLLVLVLPIHTAALLLVLAVMTVMGVTNHMGWEVFPRRLSRSPFGRWLITASHHHRHHDYYRCNYGLYFRHWDWLCGTDQGLGIMADDSHGLTAAGSRRLAGTGDPAVSGTRR